MNDKRIPQEGPLHKHRNLVILLWLISIAFALIQTWNSRHICNPDGISYLEIAAAIKSGLWQETINVYWSPLYPCILSLFLSVFNPNPFWEFATAHFANFVLFLVSLACFTIFWREFLLYRSTQTINSPGLFRIPERTFLGLGYAIFLTITLSFIGNHLYPDIIVTAFVYLIFALLIRMKISNTNYRIFLLFGFLLGGSYYAKAAMFPTAFFFLFTCLLLIRKESNWLPKIIIASLSFLLVAGPWITVLSISKGRFTFGDSGKLNYARRVSNANAARKWFHWQGDLPGYGTPKHPTRKFNDSPEMFEYADPIKGSLPLWYDASYWNEGLTGRFQLQDQINAIITNTKKLLREMRQMLTLTLFVVLFIFLYAVSSQRISFWRRTFSNYWFVIVPGFMYIAMFLLVYIDSRYIAGLVIALTPAFFSNLHFRDSPMLKNTIRYLLPLLIAVIIVKTLLSNVGLIYFLNTYSIEDKSKAHSQWFISDEIRKRGVTPGKKVAYIGHPIYIHWAHLAKVTIIADIPDKKNMEIFWKSTPAEQKEILKKFADVGVDFVLAEKVPYLDIATVPGWEEIGNSKTYFYSLPIL